MTQLLLTVVLLGPTQAEPDTPPASSTKMRQAYLDAARVAADAVIAMDYPTAIRAWTDYIALLDTLQEDGEEAEHWRTAAMLQRANAYLRDKQPNKALADLNELLRLNPDNISVYSVRAEAWDQLGQPEKAEEDRRVLRENLTQSVRTPLLPYYGPHIGKLSWKVGPLTFYWGAQGEGAPTTRRQLLSACVVLGCLAFGLFVLNTLIGIRQMTDGDGSVGSLFFVATGMSLLELAPLAIAFGLVTFVSMSTLALSWAFGAGFLTTVFLFFLGWNWLSPLRWQGTRQAPPLLDDAEALSRIAEIATQMRMAMPVVRVSYSADSSQATEAAATSLIAPCLLVSDGILHRLQPDERDGIIAHEMAHIANYSLWWWALAMSLCGSATVAMAAFVPDGPFVLFGLALYTGVYRILMRWLELDCDRRAARAVGFRAMASALEKIHAGEIFRHTPWEFLIAATGTHPSRGERLAALHRIAPPDDRPEITWSPGSVLLRRWTTAVVGLLWLGMTGGAVWWAHSDLDSWWPYVLLWAVIVIPTLFILLGIRRHKRREARRNSTRISLVSWFRTLGSLLVFGYIILTEFEFYPEYLLLPGHDEIYMRLGLLVFGLALLWFPDLSGVGKLEKKIGAAFQSRDYYGVLDLADDNPKVIARSPELRQAVAVTKALVGDREATIYELEQLREEMPAFKQTWLSLIAIYVDEGELERALELTQQLATDLPDDPAPQIEAGWLLRRLGRFDEAQVELDKAMLIDPNVGATYAARAALDFERGDLASARENLARAEQLAPGSVGNLLVEAEIAIRSGDPDAMRILEQTEKAVRENPLAVMDKQVQELRVLAEAEVTDESHPLG